MKYQIELKVHGRLYELQSDDLAFTFELCKSVMEDFEIDEDNSHLVALRAYVKVCYQLFLQSKSIDELVQRLEA